MCHVDGCATLLPLQSEPELLLEPAISLSLSTTNLGTLRKIQEKSMEGTLSRMTPYCGVSSLSTFALRIHHQTLRALWHSVLYPTFPMLGESSVYRSSFYKFVLTLGYARRPSSARLTWKDHLSSQQKLSIYA